ncbi:MFS transporter, partial [Klebsiella pneumoniae]|uniref:MFS transporter n=1 Tax=Klebsiella pneumoniae TaxID=573 RepID=UPI003567EF28
TMAVITRTFPPQRRGAAMGLWGATAGVATLVGPLAGGLLVDGLGWEWIFFINIPVGVIGFIAALIPVPQLPQSTHQFDFLGFALSAVGLFLIVFGLQEGEHFDWAAWIWAMVAAGVVVMALFVWTQARSKTEPLVPLDLFRDRNFSVSNLAIAAVGFTVTSMALPQMFYLQLARGLTPT